MKCRAQTHLPRGLRFPVPLDKGNEGSGDEIEKSCAVGMRNAKIGNHLNLRLIRISEKPNLMSHAVLRVVSYDLRGFIQAKALKLVLLLIVHSTLHCRHHCFFCDVFRFS